MMRLLVIHPMRVMVMVMRMLTDSARMRMAVVVLVSMVTDASVPFSGRVMNFHLAAQTASAFLAHITILPPRSVQVPARTGESPRCFRSPGRGPKYPAP